MNDYKILDLDTLFASSIKMDGDVIATSATLPAICRCFGVASERFNRVGLGHWMGVAIHIEGHGNVLFAVQEGHEHSHGASIWVQKNRVNAKTVIEFMTERKTMTEVKFLNPISGEEIKRKSLDVVIVPRPPKP